MTNEQSVTDRMKALLQEWEQTADRRAIFLNCYMLMTQNMLAAIADGEFNDSTWMRTFLHRFADYYFEAVEAFELDSPATPAIWRLAHRAAREPKTLVLQNLFLGINAHINYDLVLTLVDMLDSEWAQLSEQQRQQRYGDHCHVNQIISQTVDLVQDTVVERYAPFMDLVDKLFGSLDEQLTAYLISQWRTEVWEEAVRLLETPQPSEREKLRQQLEATVLKRAEKILFKKQTL
mgnify:CR=1 FL=1